MRKNYTLLGLILTLGLSTLNAQTPAKYIDRANMNLTVKPGDDFVEYANGTWLKNTKIPAKETRWGTFNQLRDFNSNAVKTILDELKSSKAAPGTAERR